MKDRLAIWWKAASQAGLDSSVSEEDQKPIRVLNQVCAAGAVVLVGYIFLGVILRIPELSILTLVGMACFSTTIFLNSRKMFMAARFFFVLVFIGIVTVTVLFTGIRGQAHFSFLINACLPLVLFRNRLVIFLLFAANISAFFIVYYLLRDQKPFLALNDTFYEIAYHVSFISITLLVFLITFYFKSSNEEYQQRILSQKEIIATRNREVRESIEYASNIQRAILTPPEVFSSAFSDHFVLFKPKDIVSGDFYKACPVSADETLFFVADCTGHGVPGALMSMVGNSRFNEIVLQQRVHRPDEILHALRQGIIELLSQDRSAGGQKDGMDIALCKYNKLTRTLQYAGANNPVWIMSNGVLRELRPDKQPVGQYHGEMRPFSLNTVQVEADACVYLFSDGLADQFGGPKGKKFKYSRMKELLLQVHTEPMSMQKKTLEQAFTAWKGELDQVDDVCVMGIRF